MKRRNEAQETKKHSNKREKINFFAQMAIYLRYFCYLYKSKQLENNKNSKVMKRVLAIAVALIASISALSAQNYMTVDSEKIFTSLADYNSAIKEIETLSTTYQANVDKRFDEVQNLYDNYVTERNSLSAAQRDARESAILKAEEEANLYQETIFSTDGELMKRRVELISPIQQKVFDAIEKYAKANGYDLVLDTTSNATILYKADNVDRTEAIIKMLK